MSGRLPAELHHEHDTAENAKDDNQGYQVGEEIRDGGRQVRDIRRGNAERAGDEGHHREH